MSATNSAPDKGNKPAFYSVSPNFSTFGTHVPPNGDSFNGTGMACGCFNRRSIRSVSQAYMTTRAHATSYASAVHGHNNVRELYSSPAENCF